jgi:hypothetical protein
MKYLISLIMTLLIAGCANNSKYNDEHMYDVASHFMNVSREVDGFIKFGDISMLTEEQILQKVLNKDTRPNNLDLYTIKLERQGENAILLLCDNDIALIEDAGCNSNIDKILWKNVTHNSCMFTIEAVKVCN